MGDSKIDNVGYELNERYQETPWVWAMENEPLENNTCYFLLDGHILFTEQVEHHA